MNRTTFFPHEYQRKVINWLYKNKQSMAWLDLGLGKSIIILWLINYLISKNEIEGCLIVCPKRVMQLTFPLELSKWDVLKDLSYTILHGKDKFKRLNEKHDIYIINYDGLASLVNHLKANPEVRPFSMVCYDEVQSLKSRSTAKFKASKWLIDITDRRVGMTATPAPEGYMGLYSSFFSIMGALSPLGNSIGRYRDKYFNQAFHCRHVYKLREGANKEIDEIIYPNVIRIKSLLDLPISYNDINIKLSKELMKEYLILQKEHFLLLGEDVIDGQNAAITLNKLRQFTSGRIKTITEAGVEGVRYLHNAKYEALADIKGNMIVCYQYIAEREAILEMYPDEAVDFRIGDTVATLADWNAGKIKYLVCHPASFSQGINMQGGHQIVFVSMPWSSSQHTQMIGRVHRQGQTKECLIHYLMVPNSVDLIIRTALESKYSTEKSLLQAVEAYRNNLI